MTVSAHVNEPNCILGVWPDCVVLVNFTVFFQPLFVFFPFSSLMLVDLVQHIVSHTNILWRFVRAFSAIVC